MAITAEKFPECDPWFLKVATDEPWELKPMSKRTRDVFEGVCLTTGESGVVRVDQTESSREALREKICVDLALVIGFETPPGLLYPADNRSRYGIVNRDFRVIYEYCQTLDLWSEAEAAKSGTDEWRSLANERYDRRAIVLDLLVANSDRFKNSGNLLVVQGPTGEFRVIPIDYGNTLGTSTYPWQSDEFKAPEKNGLPLPFPDFVVVEEPSLERMYEACGRLEGLEDDELRELVFRACKYCGLNDSDDFTDSIYRGLAFRRSQIRTWISQIAS